LSEVKTFSGSKELKNGTAIKQLESKIEKLERIIEDHERRISKLEGSPLSETTVTPGLERFSKVVGLAVDNIKSIFDIDTAQSKLMPLKLVGLNSKEKTQNAVLVSLLGYKYIFGKEEVPASDLRRIAKEHKLPFTNFGSYLNEIIPSLVRRIGEGTRTLYKLTPAGEAKAIEVVRKMVEQ
jgi:predicted RNase H-like nuclease (RuvC/YqgF family)